MCYHDAHACVCVSCGDKFEQLYGVSLQTGLSVTLYEAISHRKTVSTWGRNTNTGAQPNMSFPLYPSDVIILVMVLSNNECNKQTVGLNYVRMMATT